MSCKAHWRLQDTNWSPSNLFTSYWSSRTHSWSSKHISIYACALIKPETTSCDILEAAFFYTCTTLQILQIVHAKDVVVVKSTSFPGGEAWLWSPTILQSSQLSSKRNQLRSQLYSSSSCIWSCKGSFVSNIRHLRIKSGCARLTLCPAIWRTRRSFFKFRVFTERRPWNESASSVSNHGQLFVLIGKTCVPYQELNWDWVCQENLPYTQYPCQGIQYSLPATYCLDCKQSSLPTSLTFLRSFHRLKYCCKGVLRLAELAVS